MQTGAQGCDLTDSADDDDDSSNSDCAVSSPPLSKSVLSPAAWEQRRTGGLEELPQQLHIRCVCSYSLTLLCSLYNPSRSAQEPREQRLQKVRAPSSDCSASGSIFCVVAVNDIVLSGPPRRPA